MRHRRVNIVLAILLPAAFAAGCGGRPTAAPKPVVTGPTPEPPPRSTTLDSVFVLESSGSPPEDTVVTIAAGRARTILLRREAPDNSLFARVSLPADTGAARARDSIRVSIKPRPGQYGLDLVIDGNRPGGAVLTMSYAVHFVAPAGARSRYGSDLEFERALFIAKLGIDGKVVFYPSIRIGSDMLEAVIPGSGRYLVAAPRW
jgi:hypothetical protein